jgi:hypothetical protein
MFKWFKGHTDDTDVPSDENSQDMIDDQQDPAPEEDEDLTGLSDTDTDEDDGSDETPNADDHEDDAAEGMEDHDRQQDLEDDVPEPPAPGLPDDPIDGITIDSRADLIQQRWTARDPSSKMSRLKISDGFIDLWIRSGSKLVDIEYNDDLGAVWIRNGDSDPAAFKFDPAGIDSVKKHDDLIAAIISA